jgi:hypothetical protein
MSGTDKTSEIDSALILLDLVGLMVRAYARVSERSRACSALFAPFDPFWPEAAHTSMTIPSRANSQTSEEA